MKTNIVYLAAMLVVAAACNQNQSCKLKQDIQKAEVILTAQNTGDRLTSKGEVAFTDMVQPEERLLSVFVDQNKTFQTLVGIGGALTDASAETFYKLSQANQDKFIASYYDSVKGIGYSFARTNINSCDFSSDSYAYVNDPADTLLYSFNIDHDRKFKIPFIKKALAAAGNTIKMFASPWSPPAYMKSNKDMLHGGKLLPEYYSAWALYYVKFIEAYEKEGIPVWGLTVQNEPMAVQTWESCIYTGKDEAEFVKNYLGPQLAKSGLSNKVKLMIWDHNRGMMYQRAKAVYDDPEAAKYVWGTSFHWYMGNNYDNVNRVREAYPDKHLVFSEGCNYPFSWENVAQWRFGENYGESMIHDFNNGVCAWTDWNVLLDEQGGPNHVGNFCLAPVVADTKKDTMVYTSSYYYLGHFSKYIRPGAKRLACTTTSDDYIATAFINTDKSIVMVGMNKTDKDTTINLWIENRAALVKTPAHSIATVVVK